MHVELKNLFTFSGFLSTASKLSNTDVCATSWCLHQTPTPVIEKEISFYTQKLRWLCSLFYSPKSSLYFFFLFLFYLFKTVCSCIKVLIVAYLPCLHQTPLSIIIPDLSLHCWSGRSWHFEHTCEYLLDESRSLKSAQKSSMSCQACGWLLKRCGQAGINRANWALKFEQYKQNHHSSNWLVNQKGGKIWIARSQIEISVHFSSMVHTKQTIHKEKGSGHLLLARIPAPPSGHGHDSTSGSGSQPGGNEGGGGGSSAGRQKQSVPRRNLTCIKQGTRVWEQMRLLQGYSCHGTNLCISKMGFVRQVYFNLLF